MILPRFMHQFGASDDDESRQSRDFKPLFPGDVMTQVNQEMTRTTNHYVAII
jgi:hypothetical protein